MTAANEMTIPRTRQERVVIVGGGFGGLKLARSLAELDLQVVMIDRNNYHEFQPLFYQVATSGLEPSSICFPVRKIFQSAENFFFRIAELAKINPAERCIETSAGIVSYDHLVLAMGVDTNFFGNENVRKHAFPMKSLVEALDIRNRILENFEQALERRDPGECQSLMNIVVVGGGPTGVEVSGTLAEMKKHILPKDYHELDFSRMQVYLLEASPKLLNGMSPVASRKAEYYLGKAGVVVRLNTRVKDYDGENVVTENRSVIQARTMIWAAGVTGNLVEGVPAASLTRGNRIKVDRYNKVEGMDQVYAVGDIAFMTEEKYPKGHPQVAQVAIQQAKNLAHNFKRRLNNQAPQQFFYKNRGSLATVGRNRAVADLPGIKFQGFFAWVTWMLVHLMSLVGFKNRMVVFINWAWNYFTYDQSLRLIIKVRKGK